MKRGVGGEDIKGIPAGLSNDRSIPQKVCQIEWRGPTLPAAENISRPPQQQVLLGECKTIAGAHESLDPGCRRGRSLTDRPTDSLHTAPGDAATQLMKLCQAEGLGIENGHQGGLRHIDSHLNHTGRHQYVKATSTEVGHDASLAVRLHPPVQQPQPKRFQLSVGE